MNNKNKRAKKDSGKTPDKLDKDTQPSDDMRDETDEVTHRSVGRELAEGFAMMEDDDNLED